MLCRNCRLKLVVHLEKFTNNIFLYQKNDDFTEKRSSPSLDMTTTDRLLMTGNSQVDLISSFIIAYDISSLNSNIFENSTVTKAGKMPSIPLYTSFHALGLEICT